MNRQINTCYEIVNSSLANNLSSINHHHPKKIQRKQTCNIPTFRSFSVKKVVRMKTTKLRDFPREKDEIRGKISRLDSEVNPNSAVRREILWYAETMSSTEFC